jgi:hypothetical protein
MLLSSDPLHTYGLGCSIPSLLRLGAARFQAASNLQTARSPNYRLCTKFNASGWKFNASGWQAFHPASEFHAGNRGRLTPPGADAKSQTRQAPTEDGAGSLTTGKLNAVRAAFKAGVKPAVQNSMIDQNDDNHAEASDRTGLRAAVGVDVSNLGPNCVACHAP